MKNCIYILGLLVVFAACKSNSKYEVNAGGSVNKDTANFTQIKWLDSVPSFGTINKGEQAKITFRFKNVGTKPLFIYTVKPGCGCTLADYTKEPVAPQGEGEVTAVYNSEGATAGPISKGITVDSNTPSAPQVLSFTGEVKDK